MFNIASGATMATVATMELSETALAAQEEHAEQMLQLEIQRRARTMLVPTDDAAVKLRLRSIEEPICLFGEDKARRRDRLRLVLAEKDVRGEHEQRIQELMGTAEPGAGAGVAEAPKAKGKQETVYTAASPQLVAARVGIAAFSFERASKRLAVERASREAGEDGERETNRRVGELYKTVKGLTATATQVGDTRPLTCAIIDDTSVVTAGWAGGIKVWSRDSLKEEIHLPGHPERVTGLASLPAASPEAASIVSASADSTLRLWNKTSPEPLATLSGHVDRVCKVATHPDGAKVASASNDRTWRLWDVATQTELLMQDGHAKEVYAIAFHPDGSLVVTGDLGGVGRVWDLRCGKAIMTMKAHVKQLLSVDVSPNGFHIATGSEDHTVQIWDLRHRRRVYTIPAHTGLISQVMFSPTTGEYLVTSCFDGTLKTWCTRDWSPISTIRAHESRVFGFAVATDERHIVSVCYDKTFKLWGPSAEF